MGEGGPHLMGEVGQCLMGGGGAAPHGGGGAAPHDHYVRKRGLELYEREVQCG